MSRLTAESDSVNIATSFEGMLGSIGERRLALNYVPTADQINSTVPITRIPRPSSTDQALQHDFIDLFPTKSARVWSSNDRVLVE